MHSLNRSITVARMSKSYIWCIFLLLTVVGKSFAGGNNCMSNDKCASNNYKHNPALASLLDGYLYILYISTGYLENDINKFEQMGNNSFRDRKTDDGECCRTLQFEPGEEYNTYFDTDSKGDCSAKIPEGSGIQKLLVSKIDDDGSFCIILWGCRKTREDTVYTLCDKRKVSRKQNKWIRKQYDRMSLPALKVKQTTDYKDGKCYKNETS